MINDKTDRAKEFAKTENMSRYRWVFYSELVYNYENVKFVILVTAASTIAATNKAEFS